MILNKKIRRAVAPLVWSSVLLVPLVVTGLLDGNGDASQASKTKRDSLVVTEASLETSASASLRRVRYELVQASGEDTLVIRPASEAMEGEVSTTITEAAIEEETETTSLQEENATTATQEPPTTIEVATTTLGMEQEERVASVPSKATESDEELLLRIASCEAGDQGVEGMAYVIRVVLNRVESDEFPNNIHDVIHAKRQFSAIHTHWWRDGYVASGAREALELVYNGWDETEGALYFCMPSHNGYHSSALQYIKTYKDHEFYK